MQREAHAGVDAADVRHRSEEQLRCHRELGGRVLDPSRPPVAHRVGGRVDEWHEKEGAIVLLVWVKGAGTGRVGGRRSRHSRDGGDGSSSADNFVGG